MKTLYTFLLLLSFAGSAVAQDTIKFVYFDNFAPYSWNDNGRMKGILIDVVNNIIQTKMGIPVSHAGYPWKRAQLMVAGNKADAFITVPTPERRTYTQSSSVPIATMSVTLFTNKSNKKIQELGKVKTISDLKKFNSVSYIGNGWSKKNLQGMHVYWVPTLDKSLFLLSENKYDVFVGGSKSVWYNIKRLGYESQIVELPVILDTTSFNLCIGKESPFVHILSDFDDALKDMQRSGKLQEIYDRY